MLICTLVYNTPYTHVCKLAYNVFQNKNLRSVNGTTEVT